MTKQATATKSASKRAKKPVAEVPRTVLLNDQNRSPLYHQIYLILRSKILDGEYQPQDFLPGERELETMFGVSRITTVRALNELAAEGLVVRERGRGTRVQYVSRGIVARGPAKPAASEDTPTGASDEVFDSLYKKGSAAVTIYDFDYVKASAAVADALQLEPDDIVQRAVRVWRFEGKPFNHVTTYVPGAIGQLWSKKDLQTHPLSKLIEANGIHVALVQEQVTATLADMTLSQRLEVAVGSPILKIDRIAFDRAGKPVEYLVGAYPPDRYRYEVTLPRSGGRRPTGA